MVKAIIRSTRLTRGAERLTEEIMTLRTEDEIEEVVNRTMRQRFPLEFSEEI
jgi:hypothetical protein